MEQSKSIPVVKKEKQMYTGGEKKKNRCIPVVKKRKTENEIQFYLIVCEHYDIKLLMKLKFTHKKGYNNYF